MAHASLPFKPGALSRNDAAAYTGFGATTFDQLVRSGVMPKARKCPRVRRKVWLTEELDKSLRDLPTTDSDEQIDPSNNQNDQFKAQKKKPVVL